MTDNKPEILAPAGAWEQLEASVRAGADAVYLGSGKLNARQAAANFDFEQLKKAAGYCHERGVKLYLTVNTLVFDDELDEVKTLLRQACAAPVDAIIVQDFGVVSMARECAPELPFHASTQMTVHSPAAAALLEKLGFQRAILAREMSADEIAEVRETSEIELEAFVHGALCMSVSGQCYLSAMLGSRSGNRGRCAQPCRLPFRSGSFENCLSLKDMSHISGIDDLTAAGVSSLKIEGRLKRPEYCAAAVAACRAARDDGNVPEEIEQKLGAVFSRSGFTDGYLRGKRGAGMFGSRTKDDVTAANSSVMAGLHSIYKNEFQRVPVEMHFEAEKNTKTVLSVTDGENRCEVFGAVPAEAAAHGLEADEVNVRLSKTGGTPYFVRNVECHLDEDISLPASAINSLRREVLDALSARRRNAQSVMFSDTVSADITPYISEKQELHAVLRSVGRIPEKLPDGLQRIYIPLETPSAELDGFAVRMTQAGVVPAVEAPRGLFGNERSIRRMMMQSAERGIEYCMIHNIGLIEPAIESGLKPVGGFGLNITNTKAIEFFEKLGLNGAELSMELTLHRVDQLGGTMPRGIMIYGRQPLMLTRNCPAKLCGRCGEPGKCSIKDRMNESFPVMCRMGCSEVLNSVPLSICEKTSGIHSADWLIMRFTTESAEQTETVMTKAANRLPMSDMRITRGLYYRGVE